MASAGMVSCCFPAVVSTRCAVTQVLSPIAQLPLWFAVALGYISSKSCRAAAQYKASKQFCSGSNPKFKREINPLFLAMQIAVLEHKVYTCKAGCNVTVLLYSLNDADSLCEACHEGALCLLQGIVWSYEALAKDMLEWHDPDCLRAVHGYKLQLDARAAAPQHPSLHDVYAECISALAVAAKN